MLGEIYIAYLSENYYHKPLKNNILLKGDIRLLTSKEILVKAKKWLVASLSDTRTQQLNVSILDALTKPNLVLEDTIRPTVFDFLAHRALSVLGKIPNELADKPMPLLDSIDLKCDAEAFIQAPIITLDSFHTQVLKLRILQRLMAFHHLDTQQSALVETELIRTQLAYNAPRYDYGIKNDYLKAYEHLFDIYKNTSSVLPIVVKLSDLYEQLGGNYRGNYDYSLDYSARFALKKAMGLCQTYMNLYPQSPYFAELEQRSKRLKTISFDLKMEKVNTPNTPILTQLTYRNMDTLYGRWLYLSVQADTTFPSNDDTTRWLFCQRLPIGTVFYAGFTAF